MNKINIKRALLCFCVIYFFNSLFVLLIKKSSGVEAFVDILFSTLVFWIVDFLIEYKSSSIKRWMDNFMNRP